MLNGRRAHLAETAPHCLSFIIQNSKSLTCENIVGTIFPEYWVSQEEEEEGPSSGGVAAPIPTSLNLGDDQRDGETVLL